MKKLFGSTLLISMFIIASCSQEPIEIYMSTKGSPENGGTSNAPVNSLSAALDILETKREKNQHTTATIHLEPGEYRLDKAIKITPGLDNLTIKGSGSDKTVIKGSQKLALDWKKHTGDILVAKVSESQTFDQLYINGKQQILARYPNYDEEGGHWQGYAADAISAARLASWKQPEGAVVHAMHGGEWGGFHYVVTGIDEKGEPILTGGHQNNRPSGMHKKYRMVENVLEELDSPGEWYLSNENMLYYWPPKGLDIDKAKIEGVSRKHLIDIVGSEDQPVSNVVIERVRFEHAARTLFEEYEPLLRSDWTIYRGGAVFIEGARNVTIKDCEFTNLGGNVIMVSKYNRGVEVSGNHIHDCGATAVSFIGDPSAVRSPSFQYGEFVPVDEMDTVKGPANNQYPAGCLVDNNLIYRIGRIEKQTAGVQLSMAMDITVSNNSIYDVPRAGINVSEGTWGGHIIEFNDVFNTVLESGDHGSFNSWGRDRFWHPNRGRMNQLTDSIPEMPRWDAIHTTEIRNNRFRCDHGWDIDLDDGSSNYKIYNNVCLNGGIKLREGFFRTVENNVMVNNGFHPHVWFKNSQDVFRRNIVLAGHADIRLAGWGKEVDHNLFPNEKSLNDAKSKGVDQHSIFGDPLFLNAEQGDYNVQEESPALNIGFTYFPMDQFGVKKPSLKKIAKTPFLPVVWLESNVNTKMKETNWLGGKIKNIETMAERSASGLSKTAGVLIVQIEENSLLARSEIEIGDVIIACEGKEIDTVTDLLRTHQSNNWRGRLNLEVFRNQKSMKLKVNTKK